jgi:hypothetical protein
MTMLQNYQMRHMTTEMTTAVLRRSRIVLLRKNIPPTPILL